MTDGLAGLDAGSTVSGVVVRLGRCTLKGDLTIMHVTQERGVCGALFHPASDLALIQLRSVVAGIEAVQT